MVVIEGIQLKCAGGDVTVIHSQLGIQLENASVTDQSCLIELVRNVIDGVVLFDGYGNHFILTAKGQHIGCADPKKSAQRNTDDNDQRQPNYGRDDMGDAKQAVAFFALGATFARMSCLCLRHGFFFLLFRC